MDGNKRSLWLLTNNLIASQECEECEDRICYQDCDCETNYCKTGETCEPKCCEVACGEQCDTYCCGWSSCGYDCLCRTKYCEECNTDKCGQNCEDVYEYAPECGETCDQCPYTCGQDCTPTPCPTPDPTPTKNPTPRPPTKDPTREPTRPPETDKPTAQPRVETKPTPPPTSVTLQTTGGNDSCQGALGPLVLGSTTEGSTVDATPDTVPACGSSTAGTFSGVWYTVQGTGGMLMPSTCTGTELDTGYESQLSIWQGTCESLQCVAGNNIDPSCVSESSVSWPTISGQLYYILVHGKASTPGIFGITLTTGSARSEISGVQSFHLSSSIRMVTIGALFIHYV